MKTYLQKEPFKKSDEAWIVVDRDNWSEDQLRELQQWAKNNDNYGFALSNPNFEYWLLLHFEEGNGIRNSQECSTRLKKHWYNYNKDIDGKKISFEQIKEAITRARKRDSNSLDDLPRVGSTRVYKLVERIFSEK